MTLRLAFTVDGDAAGAKDAFGQAAREVEQLTAVARRASAELAAAARASDPEFAKLNGVLGQAQTVWKHYLADVDSGLKSLAKSAHGSLGQIGDAIGNVFSGGPGGGPPWKNLADQAAGRVASLITPANAISLALQVAAGAAGYFFAQIGSDAPPAERLLEEHARLIGVVKDAYRDAAKEAGEFFKQSKEVTLLQAQQALIGLRGNLARQSQGVVSGISTPRSGGLSDMGDMPDAPMAMRGGIEVTAQWKQFADTIDRFNKTVEAGAPDVEGFRNEVAKIGLAAAENDPRLAAQANKLLETTKAAGETAYSIKQAEASVRLMQGTATEADRALLGLSTKTKKAATEAREAADEFDRAEKSLRKKTEAVEAEAVAFNMSATEAARYKAEQLLLNAAQAASRDLSPELVASIKAQADRYAEATGRLKELAQRREGIDMLRDQTRSFIGDLKSGLVAGEKFWDSFAAAVTKAADRIGDKLIELATNDFFAAMGGSRGTGLGSIASLFGLGGAAPGAIGAGAGGSAYSIGFGGQMVPVFHQGRVPGRPASAFRLDDPAAWWGAPRFHDGRFPPSLAPGELRAILRDDEWVVPDRDMRRAGGMHVTVGVSVDRDGNLQAYVKDVAQQTTSKGLRDFAGSSGFKMHVKDSVQTLRKARQL